MKFLACAVILAVLVAVSEGNETPKLSAKSKSLENSGTAKRDKLFSKLFDTYNKDNYPENSTVNVGVSLLDVGFDSDKDVMNSHVWMRMTWTDDRFSWDESEFGVNVLRVPAEKVWQPDIALYNGVHNKMDCYDTNVLVYPSGLVLWVPPCHIQSYCNLTLNHGPYEEQVCTLKFGSWTFDGYTMGLELYKDKNSTLVDVSYFNNRQYSITQNAAIKEEKKYDCCVEPYYDVLFTLGFQRKPEVAPTCVKN
ncbi:acetylcholine receptor subunit alpha-type acr-16 [Folsomia candida]|uniref:Acetylcholine receptor subunit alpha-type acr-16 n=1 Tax=Folsomia candida TaxID=158441 RepID=A0A226DPT7_FOLCA|nr:acetylcholine receptor subunit alpha-type acr-16 [Folsomia candida]OXA47522.1 Acetylcholine receptor subunit alpha-type acr-16 [Folsomia candida]